MRKSFWEHYEKDKTNSTKNKQQNKKRKEMKKRSVKQKVKRNEIETVSCHILLYTCMCLNMCMLTYVCMYTLAKASIGGEYNYLAIFF